MAWYREGGEYYNDEYLDENNIYAVVYCVEDGFTGGVRLYGFSIVSKGWERDTELGREQEPDKPIQRSDKLWMTVKYAKKNANIALERMIYGPDIETN